MTCCKRAKSRNKFLNELSSRSFWAYGFPSSSHSVKSGADPATDRQTSLFRNTNVLLVLIRPSENFPFSLPPLPPHPRIKNLIISATIPPKQQSSRPSIPPAAKTVYCLFSGVRLISRSVTGGGVTQVDSPSS